MKTPCVKQCKLVSDVCASCGRTRRQIVNWSEYSDKQREHIIKTLSKAAD